MYKALHSRNDIDRLYVSTKEGGRGLDSIEDYMKNNKERLIRVTRNNIGDTMINRKTKTGK